MKRPTLVEHNNSSQSLAKQKWSDVPNNDSKTTDKNWPRTHDLLQRDPSRKSPSTAPAEAQCSHEALSPWTLITECNHRFLHLSEAQGMKKTVCSCWARPWANCIASHSTRCLRMDQGWSRSWVVVAAAECCRKHRVRTSCALSKCRWNGMFSASCLKQRWLNYLQKLNSWVTADAPVSRPSSFR